MVVTTAEIVERIVVHQIIGKLNGCPLLVRYVFNAERRRLAGLPVKIT